MLQKLPPMGRRGDTQQDQTASGMLKKQIQKMVTIIGLSPDPYTSYPAKWGLTQPISKRVSLLIIKVPTENHHKRTEHHSTMFVTNPRAIKRDSLCRIPHSRDIHRMLRCLHTTTYVQTEAAQTPPVSMYTTGVYIDIRNTIFKVGGEKLPKWSRVEPGNVVGDLLSETPKK